MKINKDQPSSRRAFLALCTGVVTAANAGAATPRDPLSRDPSPPAEDLTAQANASPSLSLKGKLKAGIMGPGGETTGYALVEPRLASNNLEIDMSSVKDARNLDGRELIVDGVFQTRVYVERGRVTVFKAAAARVAAS